VCVDGDPACDVEGACTFRVAVCLNQPHMPGCTPQPRRTATASDGALVVPAAEGAEAVCGPHVTVEVPLRGRPSEEAGTKKIRLVAVATTAKPRKDVDTIRSSSDAGPKRWPRSRRRDPRERHPGADGGHRRAGRVRG
jgi:hypothetical protein